MTRYKMTLLALKEILISKNDGKTNFNQKNF